MEIRGLQHVGIPTSVYGKTLDFYTALGFRIAHTAAGKSGNPISFLKLGDLVLEVVEKPETKMDRGAIDHIALDVRDIEECYREITGKGFPILEGEIRKLDFWSNGVKYFTIEGPNKEKVEFSQYL